MKRLVNVGNEIRLENVCIDGQVLWRLKEMHAENTRGRIVLAVVIVGSIFLIGAALIGLFEGSFDKLQTIWGVVAIPMGWFGGYYFRVNKEK